LKRLVFFIIGFILFLNLSFAQQFPRLLPEKDSQGFKKSGPITVNGDKIEYLQAKKQIIGTGNVSISYGDVRLTCEKITVYTDKKVGICEGNVKITQPMGIFHGESIEYDFANKTGKVINGYVASDPFYGYAERVEKVSEEKVVFDGGCITTCDHEHPHYRIEAKQIRLYLDDKVVANHVFFYIGNVPVFYTPYYMQPIKDLKTKISLIPGYDDNWGYYALGAYRFYINELCKGYIRLDYRTKKGLAQGLDYGYDLKELGDGLARFYFAQEGNDLCFHKETRLDDRWRFQYKHKIDFSPRTNVYLELNKLSDRDVVKDYFYNEYEEGMRDYSYASLISSEKNYSLQALTRFRTNNFVTLIERLPELKLQVNKQRIGNTLFYYENIITYNNFLTQYDEILEEQDERAQRFDSYHTLSLPFKVLKFLDTTPRASIRETFYSENRFGTKNVLRLIYEYGLDFSTKFYRLFNIDTTIIDLNQLRHIINPVIKFYHRTQPSISPTNLFQFDEVDAMDYQNGINFYLENKLQTKRMIGGKEESVDFLRFIIDTDYYYRFKKGGLRPKGVGVFGDVMYRIELRPYQWCYAQTELKTHFDKTVKEYQIFSWNSDLVISIEEKLEFAVSHLYLHSATETSSEVTMEGEYRINKDWAIRSYQRYDVQAMKHQEQEYTIKKDLHCWEMDLTCNVQQNDISVWVMLRLKAFPDMPIGLRRTISRPTPGSERL